MKLVIYTVAQKTPPLGEPVYRWNVYDSPCTLVYWGVTTAEVSIPEPGEEPLPGTHPTLAWNGRDMYYDDLWSYTTPVPGE